MHRLTYIVLGTTTLVCFLTNSVQAENIVPLKRGYYVTTNVACSRASNATLTLFTGKSFGFNCSAKVQQIHRQTFKISQACHVKDERIESVGTYLVLNDREYVLKNEHGEFRNHFCEQTQLPGPWSTNDLSDIAK